MPQSNYPLKALLDLRGREVDEASAALGARVSERQSAEHALACAEAELREAQARVARARSERVEQLDRDTLRSVDFARFSEWEKALESEVKALTAKVEVASNVAAVAAAAEEDARVALGERATARSVVARDEARFLEGARKKDAAREEEAAEEAFRGGQR